MRVTLVQIHLTGGASTDCYHVQVFGLARRLAEQGCEVTVISSAGEACREQPGADLRGESRDGYKVVYLPVKAEFLHQTLVAGLTEALGRSRPDVVQVAELVELTTLQTALWCRRNGIPCIIWHGAYDFYGKGVPAQKAYIHTAGRFLCRISGGMIAKSTSAKLFLQSLGADPGKVHTIPVGLDTASFLRKPERLADLSWIPPEPFIMNVGQMVPRKNQASLIRALERICADEPEFRLLIVGRGPESDSLAALARKLGLKDRVVLQMERVPNTMLARVYNRAFLTAMPSMYEIFGMTTLESFASGTPVVGRRTGGIADLIQDGVNGWVYDEDDSGSISNLVLRLYRDREVYDALRKSTEASSSCYDWAAVAPKFLAVYSKCLLPGKADGP